MSEPTLAVLVAQMHRESRRYREQGDDHGDLVSIIDGWADQLSALLIAEATSLTPQYPPSTGGSGSVLSRDVDLPTGHVWRAREAEAARPPEPKWMDMSMTVEEAVSLKARVEALEGALRSLANEAAGFVSMADRETHGNTNIAVLNEKIAEALAVLRSGDRATPKDQG